MTKWEGVRRLESHTQYFVPVDDLNAFDVAVAALRAQAEAERGPMKTTWETPETCPRCMEHLSMAWSFCPECGRPTDWSENNPLTVEELRAVSEEEDFGSHIWVKNLQFGYVLAAITDVIDEEVLAVWSYGEGDCYWEHDYGKTWLAYRRKPKEGTT